MGQSWKNFKDCCNYWNIPIGDKPSTNTRKAILKRFEKYFKVEKQGQKLVVTEIFHMPATKEQFKSDRDLLDDLFENQLLLIFTEADQKTITFRKKELWEKLGMINKRYNRVDFKTIESKAIEEHIENLEKWMYERFLERSYSINDRKVKQILNHLQNKGLLKFDEVMWKATDKGHCQATDDEISFILDCRLRAKVTAIGKYKMDKDNNYLLDEEGNKVPTKFQDIRSNVRAYKKYKKWLHIYLLEKGINYTYQRYKIVLCNEKFIKEAYEDNLIVLCKKVNNRIQQLIDNNADQEQLNKYPKCKDYAKLQKWLSHQLIYLGIDFEEYLYTTDKEVVSDEDYDIDDEAFEKLLPWK